VAFQVFTGESDWTYRLAGRAKRRSNVAYGMKWRVLLKLTEANGHVQTHEMVTGDRPTNATSPETIGPTLAEGKSVLAAMETQLVQAQ
jgi:hypothetical protein